MASREILKQLRERWFGASAEPELIALANTISAGPRFEGPADLRGVPWSADTRPSSIHKLGVNLGSEISDVDFSFGVFDGAVLSSSTFKRCNFAHADFKQANLIGATFIECNFDGSTLNAFVGKAQFAGSSFANTHFRGGRGSGARDVEFRNCGFASSRFTNIDFRNARFLHCNFDASEFKNCDLYGTEFLDAAPEPDQFVNCYQPPGGTAHN